MLETAIYSDDLARAHSFYGDVLGLERVLDTPRMLTYAVAPAQVLLVFKRGATREDSETAGRADPRPPFRRPGAFRLRHRCRRLRCVEGASRGGRRRHSQRDDMVEGRAGASISTIRTATSWSWRRRDSGRTTDRSFQAAIVRRAFGADDRDRCVLRNDVLAFAEADESRLPGAVRRAECPVERVAE